MRKRVGDIFCRNIIGVPEDTKVSEALRVMNEHKISSILVLEDGRAKGIFTERDVVRSVAEKGLGFNGHPISEYMSSNVFAISAQAYLFEAFQMLEEHNIRHLVVQGEDRLVIGMVTQSDMIMHLGYEYFLKVKYVSQIMSRDVFTIGGESPVGEAVREMARRKVSVLVVVQDQRPVGVFTERDVTRLATSGIDLDDVRVSEVMSSPVLTLHEDEATFRMAEVIREHGVRRVVVVDYDGRIVGVATQTDLVRGMESKYIESLKGIIKVQGQELERTVR
ncbi:MAG: histidine kinase, partial [Desulfovibrio sp.]|nr:histidine kinase [Desulfovibrio sp.]